MMHLFVISQNLRVECYYTILIFDLSFEISNNVSIFCLNGGSAGSRQNQAAGVEVCRYCLRACAMWILTGPRPQLLSLINFSLSNFSLYYYIFVIDDDIIINFFINLSYTN